MGMVATVKIIRTTRMVEHQKSVKNDDGSTSTVTVMRPKVVIERKTEYVYKPDPKPKLLLRDDPAFRPNKELQKNLLSDDDGSLSGALPGALPNALPGALPGALPDALPGALPGALSGALPGAFYSAPSSVPVQQVNQNLEPIDPWVIRNAGGTMRGLAGLVGTRDEHSDAIIATILTEGGSMKELFYGWSDDRQVTLDTRPEIAASFADAYGRAFDDDMLGDYFEGVGPAATLEFASFMAESGDASFLRAIAREAQALSQEPGDGYDIARIIASTATEQMVRSSYPPGDPAADFDLLTEAIASNRQLMDGGALAQLDDLGGTAVRTDGQQIADYMNAVAGLLRLSDGSSAQTDVIAELMEGMGPEGAVLLVSRLRAGDGRPGGAADLILDDLPSDDAYDQARRLAYAASPQMVQRYIDEGNDPVALFEELMADYDAAGMVDAPAHVHAMFGNALGTVFGAQPDAILNVYLDQAGTEAEEAERYAVLESFFETVLFSPHTTPAAKTAVMNGIGDFTNNVPADERSQHAHQIGVLMGLVERAYGDALDAHNNPYETNLAHDTFGRVMGKLAGHFFKAVGLPFVGMVADALTNGAVRLVDTSDREIARLEAYFVDRLLASGGDPHFATDFIANFDEAVAEAEDRLLNVQDALQVPADERTADQQALVDQAWTDFEAAVDYDVSSADDRDLFLYLQTEFNVLQAVHGSLQAGFNTNLQQDAH